MMFNPKAIANTWSGSASNWAGISSLLISKMRFDENFVRIWWKFLWEFNENLVRIWSEFGENLVRFDEFHDQPGIGLQFSRYLMINWFRHYCHHIECWYARTYGLTGEDNFEDNHDKSDRSKLIKAYNLKYFVTPSMSLGMALMRRTFEIYIFHIWKKFSLKWFNCVQWKYNNFHLIRRSGLPTRRRVSERRKITWDKLSA